MFEELEDLALACEPYRRAEVKETALVVVQDKELQRVLAVWPMVAREVLGEPLAVPSGDWKGLWETVKVNQAGLFDMCGLPAGRGQAAFRRAIALRLIYPDGSLHSYGKMVVQKLIKDALQG